MFLTYRYQKHKDGVIYIMPTNPVSELRAASGLSWAEIGEITGSHRTTVMRWEKEEWDIPKGMLALLERLVAEHRAAKRKPAKRRRNGRAGK